MIRAPAEVPLGGSAAVAAALRAPRHATVIGAGHRDGARARFCATPIRCGAPGCPSTAYARYARGCGAPPGAHRTSSAWCCSTARGCWPAPRATTWRPGSTAASAACSASARSSPRASCAAAARRRRWSRTWWTPPTPRATSSRCCSRTSARPSTSGSTSCRCRSSRRRSRRGRRAARRRCWCGPATTATSRTSPSSALTRAAGARLALDRTEDYIRYAIARRRLLAGLGPARPAPDRVPGRRGRPHGRRLPGVHRASRPLDHRGGRRSRSRPGARLGAMLQVMLAREPSLTPPEITGWWPHALAAAAGRGRVAPADRRGDDDPPAARPHAADAAADGAGRARLATDDSSDAAARG